MSPVELTDGEKVGGGGIGGGAAKSYDGEEALSSINHSIFSGYKDLFRIILHLGETCYARNKKIKLLYRL